MTISEEQFEHFCRQASIPCTRLAEGEEKTADYDILLGGQRIIVEVKEIKANEADRQALCELREKHSAGRGTNKVGSRIRNKIGAAKRQIERLAAGKCPGVLLLYDTRSPEIRGVWPYEILVAMYGYETIDVHVSEDSNEPVRFGTHRFGKGKKLGPDCHTYISAIGILRETVLANVLHIDLYHNVYADHPLPLAEIVPRKDMTVFSVAPGGVNEFRGWAQIVTKEEKEANKASEATLEPASGAVSSAPQG